MTTINAHTIDSHLIAGIVKNHYEIGQPLMLWGPPGVGKTQGVIQAAKELGLPCLTETVSTHGEGSCGLPIVDFQTNTHTTTRPDWFPTQPSILFLDELAEAADHLRVPLYRLVLEGRLRDGVELPEGSLVVAAGNPSEDGSLYGDFPPALTSRFCHYLVKVDPMKWVKEYAIPAGVPTAVIGFIKARPDLLLTRDENMSINPSPRTWADVIGKAVKGGMATWTVDQSMGYCLGTLGESTGIAFFQHLQDVVKAPEPELMLRMNAKQWASVLPTRMSCLYSLAYSVPKVCSSVEQYIKGFELMKFIGEVETSTNSSSRDVTILGYHQLTEQMFTSKLSVSELNTIVKVLETDFPEVMEDISKLTRIQQGQKVD
jgi:DNA polymerase III delta prime subunit